MIRIRSNKLLTVFDARKTSNSLNSVRLLLASGVIVQHGHVAQQGVVFSSRAADQLIGQLPVDGFFALSGFLIAKSWADAPHVSDFLLARVARIFPGFLVCLVVTGLVLAPVSSVALGRPVFWANNLGYVWRNASLVIFQNGIRGTLSSLPYPNDWNASLWTLKWEFACYVVILVSGVCAILARRSYVAAGFSAIWACNLWMDFHSVSPFVLDAGRLTLMFASGTVLYVYAKYVPLSAVYVASSGAVIVCAAFLLDDYRIISAPLVGYLVIGAGLLLPPSRLATRNDVSYGIYIYGFPVQQLLIMFGVGVLPLPLFCIVSLSLAFPVALLSWKLVEHPILRVVKRRRRRRSVNAQHLDAQLRA